MPAVSLKAERINNDTRRGVLDDYDKMAEQNPEASIWIVESRKDAHAIIGALNDTAEGQVRVEKSYSESTAPHRFTIDEPGLTDIYTFTHLRNTVLE